MKSSERDEATLKFLPLQGQCLQERLPPSLPVLTALVYQPRGPISLGLNSRNDGLDHMNGMIFRPKKANARAAQQPPELDCKPSFTPIAPPQLRNQPSNLPSLALHFSPPSGTILGFWGCFSGCQLRPPHKHVRYLKTLCLGDKQTMNAVALYTHGPMKNHPC